MKKYTVSPGLKRCLIVVITDGAPDDGEPIRFTQNKERDINAVVSLTFPILRRQAFSLLQYQEDS